MVHSSFLILVNFRPFSACSEFLVSFSVLYGISDWDSIVVSSRKSRLLLLFLLLPLKVFLSSHRIPRNKLASADRSLPHCLEAMRSSVLLPVQMESLSFLSEIVEYSWFFDPYFQCLSFFDFQLSYAFCWYGNYHCSRPVACFPVKVKISFFHTL